MVKKTTEAVKPADTVSDTPSNDLQRMSGNFIKDTIVVETVLPLTDIQMYASKFEDLEPGLYKVDYRCPRYNMMLTVSWDGERLV
jgi:hypothetical protein